MCGSDAVLNLNQINSTTERLTALSNLTGALGNQSPSSLLSYTNSVNNSKTGSTCSSSSNSNKIGCLVSAVNSNNTAQANIQPTGAKSNQTTIKSGPNETGKSTINASKGTARSSSQCITSKNSTDDARKINNVKIRGTFDVDEAGTVNDKKGSDSPNESVKSFTGRGDELGMFNECLIN